MARPLRTAAALSLCAILIPTGCDSPISPPDIAPSAAVTPDGTVITTAKEVVPVDAAVSAQCLNDFEPFAISGALAVTHYLRLTPTFDAKVFQMKLSTVVLPEGVSLVGMQSAEELIVVGADKADVTREATLPTGTSSTGNLRILADVLPSDPPAFGYTLHVQVDEDFGITTTVEDVQLVCPPPDAYDGTIVVTKQDMLSIDTEVTTGCFNDGVEEKVAVSGVLGVLNHVKLTPIDGMEYLMDLSTVAWSQGIQLVGVESAAEARAVGVVKAEMTLVEVQLPASLNADDWPDPPAAGWSAHLDGPGSGSGGAVASPTLRVEIAEDFGITTTFDKIEILCPPPPVVDN